MTVTIPLPGAPLRAPACSTRAATPRSCTGG